MKRRHLVIIIATIVTASLLLGATKPRTEWEYARFRYGGSAKWNWIAPGVSEEGRNLHELCKRLGTEIRPNEVSVYTFLDWAGSQGWELVIINERSGYIISWLKRPK
jgi:hypothetical protein